MEKFINKKVAIVTCLGGMDGSQYQYNGTVTSYDEEYICLDNKTYISRKLIMAIIIKRF